MIDFSSFLPEDPNEAKRIFNVLPVEQQLDIALKARGKERLHYLFLSENPEKLVHRLPELELFLTVKEVGDKDSVDLISMTTPEQFQYLLDLELWKKDQLSPEKILHWMELLHESGEQKVVQFIRTADPEFIALLLKKFLRVTTLEGELLESADRIPFFTLDQYYFIDFKGKEAGSVFVPFLKTLYRLEGEEYRRLMEALLVELDSEMEETGYRLRNARMKDYGFPDFEEALEIYRFVDPDSLALKEGSSSFPAPKEMEIGNPTFFLTFQDEGPFLSSILSKMSDPVEQRRLNMEMTALCNKAMIAEPLDLFEMGEMKRVAKKVFHYLNIGLQYFSGEQEAKALEAIRFIPLQKIFQCGVSATLLVKKKAESVLRGSWFSGRRESLRLLDPPYFERFEGILKRRPGWIRNGVLEDFKNLQDLKEAEAFLEFIEVIVSFLKERAMGTPQSLEKLDLPNSPGEITLSTIFLTAFGNQILKGTFQYEAIEKDRLKVLFLRIFEKAEGKGVVRMEIRKGLSEWICSEETDENKRYHLLAFKDFCLDLLEEEYGRISPEEEIDPRFVKGLFIRT